MIDLLALRETPLQSDPFDFVVVPHFLDPDNLAAVRAGYPALIGPGNHRSEALESGAAFSELLKELQSSALTRHVEAKFGVDLSDSRLTITVRRYCEATDGHIHTDHRSKIVTMLLYLNDDWKAEGGQLRFLRSSRDLNDLAAEVRPLGGTMLAFRSSEKSFHGHLPYVGERRMIQMSWINPGILQRFEKSLSRLTKPARRLLNVS